MILQSVVELLLLMGPGSVLAARFATCKETTFQVMGSAMNRNLTGVPLGDPDALLSLIQADTFPRILVSGPQTLAGTYCEPTVQNGNKEKLQVLFHSITGNRDTWSAQGGTSLGFPPFQPQNYSYVDFMNERGYPTLALDRLGAGQSSHPDPVLVVQGPYEDALYHDLVTQIRAGNSTQLPRAFSTLIYVGNSYGSELGTSSAEKFPNDFNSYILTGFSKSVRPSLPGVSLQGPAPAAVISPARFGGLDPGYVTSPVETTRTNSFFGSPEDVDFDPEVAQLFFEREDVVSVGQFISTYIGPVEAPKYKGRVLVLTGEQDQAFCGPGSSALVPPAHCGPLLKQTKALFPVADYNWKSVNRTGHAIMLHESARTTYKIAEQFLAGEKFAGGPPA